MFFICLSRPVWGFWLSLALFFDPGGFFEGYFNSNLIGPVNVSDALFLLFSLAFLINRKTYRTKIDHRFSVFFKYFLFVELYFILVYGYLIPVLREQNVFSLFLIKERNVLYGIFILWYVYHMMRHGLITHYRITVVTGFTVLILYIVGLLVGFYIVPSGSFERYQGENIMRVGMISYGLFQSVLPLALIVFLLNKSFRVSLPHKRILYIAGILMVIVYLLTLTRRTFINLAATIIFATWFIYRITHIKQRIIRFIFATTVAILALFLTFPEYLNYSKDIYIDSYLLITTGSDTRGKFDYRISGTGDLEIVKDYIRENPWIGEGFTWMSWGEKIELALQGDRFAKAWDAAQEVPIYYMIFSKGIIGLIIYTPVYVFLIISLFTLYKRLKKHFCTLLFYNPVVFLFSILLLVNYLMEFTVKVYSLFGNVGKPMFMLQAGLLFGINTFINNRYET